MGKDVKAVSLLMENNVIFNSMCCEVHVTLAGAKASQDSALKRISVAGDAGL